MNTLEGNLILAKFMNARVDDLHTVFDKKDFVPNNFILTYANSTLEFHKNWNWLIPVVEKCKSTFDEFGHNSLEMIHIETEIFNLDWLISEFFSNDIKAIWERCINFIQWYKKQKENVSI